MMNALAALLTLATAGLAALVVVELRPQPAASDPGTPPSQRTASLPPAPPPALNASPASFVGTLLARPPFSQARRPPNTASSAAVPASAATPLPRMTGILIDGPRRSAIFAAAGASPGGRPTIVAEGGRIGSFTVQTIEPQQVIVIGPQGKRIVRTSFDPTLQPAPAPPTLLLTPPTAPSTGYGLPQTAGAAR